MEANKFIELAVEHESWVIALASASVALISVYIGHWLTMRLQKKRAKALETGLNNELEILKDDFSTWLLKLFEEYKSPRRFSYSGYSGFDMNCIDSLVVALIAENKVLSKDQRKLLINIKPKINGLIEKDKKRDEETSWDNYSCRFHVSENHTAFLIVNVVEVLYYLIQYEEMRDKFSFKEGESWEKMAKLSFRKAGLDFDDNDVRDLDRYYSHA